MTIHLISVGVSLTDALRGGKRRAEIDHVLIRNFARHQPWEILGPDTAKASDWLTGALAAKDSGDRDLAQAARLAETVEGIQPGLWPSWFSAELDTFDRDPAAKRPLSEDDVAVLVSSDTAAGLAAGLWNAVALVNGKLARVRYLADPAAPVPDIRGQVLLVRVPRLDAGDPQGFCDAMRGLGTLGHSLRYGVALKREPFRCYLSGGFKAAIPYLIGLAEGLRSLPGSGQVDAIVLHEITERDPIQLPLRRMAPGMVREELSGFGADGLGYGEPEGFLEGYAYERFGSHCWQLTAFGEGLRALFGIPPEGLGE